MNKCKQMISQRHWRRIFREEDDDRCSERIMIAKMSGSVDPHGKSWQKIMKISTEHNTKVHCDLLARKSPEQGSLIDLSIMKTFFEFAISFNILTCNKSSTIDESAFVFCFR